MERCVIEMGVFNGVKDQKLCTCIVFETKGTLKTYDTQNNSHVSKLKLKCFNF